MASYSSTQTRPRVRLYNASTDREALRSLFAEIYHDSVYKFSILTTINYIAYCRAYLDISPDSCFVLDNGTIDQPNVVGYLAGTPDSEGFCRRFTTVAKPDIDALNYYPAREEMLAMPTLVPDFMNQRKAWAKAVNMPEKLVYDIAQGHVGKYPAHFHMAVAPGYQGDGLGRDLINAFKNEMSAQDVTGIFAAVPWEAKFAMRMYEKKGWWERLPAELDRGESGELGVTAGLDSPKKVFYVTALPAMEELERVDEAVVLSGVARWCLGHDGV